MDYRYLYFTR